ncbi:TPA: LysR family transcriptional regulator [Stenotrophomonas maltophilia]|uniref:LysR family transcriptional regulator n=1 Tax=Stenotrophomonas maltophilia TaxID=40324 RepID=A0AAI9CB62_STEMA|nr:LysR family transcriptional regulator [Stenotrophomonas maltophilia]EKT4441459.1 LysR family transcriptional regulator [Stenotrophomonas maltophilia]MBN5012303.1 LysR family transcriptional regulator [Stenotrophomonas maltophilia]HDS1086186.1 LysR family transcriptional regulator [Stenotrophomonas maltophilia]HDS1304027.1 LysR family transcriptional regulator [Stenotrophomonas maltophilia]HDS1821045.1 LysR family transcriptional regulator [Stenotrophomonas maltophilia]
MNLKQLEFAVALAEEGNFTRAAERCHVVQSALSHQIAYLEQELGTPLFERLPRQVRATAAGEALLVHARQVMASLRHLRADVAAVSGEVRGLLAIGQISSLTDIDVVAMLAAFQQAHPQVEFQLRVDKSEDLIAQVQSRDLDVALVGLAPSAALDGVCHQMLQEEDLVAVLAPSHRLARRKQLPLTELQDEALVDFPRGTGARRQTDDAFAAAGLPHTVRFEVNLMELVERFVRHGLAVGIVPALIAEGFEGVVRIPLQPTPTRRVHLVWQRLPTQAARAFVEAVLSRAGAGSGP